MSLAVLSHFGVLDELIQVIYQGFERFVLLSKVDDESWTVYLALQGPEGRWWRGRWQEKDILHLTGAKASEIILEGFADKLADIIIKGEASIGDWNSERGAKINLTLGSTDKTPVHIPLIQLAPEEAASHATRMFWDIALTAQSRKCRLNGPSSYIPPSLPLSGSREVPATTKPESTTVNQSKEERKVTPVTASVKKAQEEIKTLKAELAQEKKRSAPQASASASKARSAVPQPHKVAGASLANPNKRVRKIQAIEFESDEE